ncbi:MAG TPA: hypothetical protein VNA88_18830, partial [Candidatus Kapabacteria bacterium]|nr:hypothetical protein [Candidatus Kapabacteria bacterium]
MRILFLVLLALATPSILSSQWLPEEAFPEGEYLRTFMLDGDSVIAGGDRLYRSSNRGTAWREVTTIQNYMHVTRIERSGDAVLALGDTALWRSLDGGETWSVSLSWGYLAPGQPVGFGEPVQLAIASQGRLAVATKSWVELSSDNGVTWRRTARGPGLYNHPSALALIGGRIHVGEPAGHRYSTDGGATWIESPEVDGRKVAAMQFVWTPDGTLHAATTSGYYYSSDTGSTWMRRVPSDTLNASIDAMAIEADTIWTAHYGYFMTSTDRGATWRSVLPSDRRVGRLRKIVWADDTLWAASSGLGFVWSTDDGLTWHERNRGMPGQINDNGVFYDRDEFYDFGTFALLTTPVGILRTLDSGRTWTKHDSLFARIDRRLGGEIFDIVR